MQNKNNKKNRGYTIIETMITVSIFIIVVMAGMGALLNANAVHNKSQNMRSIMDSLSFIMEDMSKNLRTGYNYHCILIIEDIPTGTPAPQNCTGENGGRGISFWSAFDTNQWVYYVDDTAKGRGIFKSVLGAEPTQMTPDEVDITLGSFSVFGAEPPPPNPPFSSTEQQPFVTIRLVGKIKYKDIETPFSLQTSVSQRKIDI